LANLLGDDSTVLRVNPKVKCINIHAESVLTFVRDLVSDFDGTVILVEHVQNTSYGASNHVDIDILSNVCDDVSSHHGRLIDAITVGASLRSFLSNHTDGVSEVVFNKICSTGKLSNEALVAVLNVPSPLIPFVVILASVPELANGFFVATVLVAGFRPALVATAVVFFFIALTPVASPPGPALTIIEGSAMVIGKEIEGTHFLVFQSKVEDKSFENLSPKVRIVDLSDSFNFTFTAISFVPGKLRGTGVPANFVISFIFDRLAVPEATVSLHQHTWVNWG